MEQLQSDLVELFWHLPAIMLWVLYLLFKKAKTTLIKVKVEE